MRLLNCNGAPLSSTGAVRLQTHSSATIGQPPRRCLHRYVNWRFPMPIKPRPFKLIVSIAAFSFSALIVCSGLALTVRSARQPAAVRLITREVSLGNTRGEVEYSRVISDDQKHIAFTVK